MKNTSKSARLCGALARQREHPEHEPATNSDEQFESEALHSGDEVGGALSLLFMLISVLAVVVAGIPLSMAPLLPLFVLYGE